MSYFASSASPTVAHWHDTPPGHLIESVTADIEKGWSIALEEAREIVVEAGYELGHIAEVLGIHDFTHQVSCDLTGCRLIVRPHGHLEIHREGKKYPSSFPIRFHQIIQDETTAI